MSKKPSTIFAFDVGMESLGVAVNKNNEVSFSDVLLIHPEAGSTRAAAEERRGHITREAHKERERRLEELWQSIGKKPLERKRFEKTKDPNNGRKKFDKISKADRRLEREFPSKEDETVYASSLLRIKLLEGENLQDWQIYKALHAGIQRRGYDIDVPWKTREKERNSDKEDPEKQVGEFEQQLKKMTEETKYHFPCYYDAWKMGLWDNKQKKVTAIRQPRRSQEKGKDRARGYNPSRELVEKEVRRLLEQAAEQIPALKPRLTNGKLNELLYGNQDNALDTRYPSHSKREGLLGQKYPRFDNRIIAKCALIPRLNVCRAKEPLAIQVGFLMRLVNWRYEKTDSDGEKQLLSPTGDWIKDRFQECVKTWESKETPYDAEEYAKCFKLTKSKIKKMAEKLGGFYKPGHEEIPESKFKGRSRFSRPALHILKELILSNETPTDFHKRLSKIIKNEKQGEKEKKFGYKVFDDCRHRYFLEDLQFLQKMGDTRDGIHVPDMSLAEKYLNQTGGNIDEAITKVISSCNWPELRHRLNVFKEEMEILITNQGKPDAIHIEFIREDFLSEKRKSEYKKQSTKGRDDRQAARDGLKELNISDTERNIMLYRLMKEQGKQCPYTGDCIDETRLEEYEIDHIFPRERGGPDAYYNKVITSRSVNNDDKGDRLPCECSFIKEEWEAYKNRVKSLQIPKTKERLLLATNRDEANELIDKYTGLSGTAHIAKLARDIACLRLGWQPGAKGREQRVFVVSGGLTNKVARKYKLYELLGTGSDPYNKPRDDRRHHALDAMIISYLPQWARDRNKTDFFKFPKGIDADYFANMLKDVYPHYITKRRPMIAEQPLGKREKLDIREFRNISKDPEERGQYYTNKTETGKGTYQHGYIFYKDSEGGIQSKTVHSFHSPYAASKEVEKKASEIIGFFHQGMTVRLPDQSEIKATKLGRPIQKMPFGQYKVAELRKNDATIQEDNQPTSYRIKTKTLKEVLVSNQLEKGDKFDLDNFKVDQEKIPTGTYKCSTNGQTVEIINTNTGETVPLTKVDRLVKYLREKKEEEEIQEGTVIDINHYSKDYVGNGVKTDDLPQQTLPNGTYIVKSFASKGKTLLLISQNGDVYRLDGKILKLHNKTNSQD